MHNKLLIEAFKKAKQETQTEKVYPRAKLLSDFIFEDSREQYGERILREKFNEIEKQGSKIRLKKHAQDALCRYLGYENYTEFVKVNSNDTTKKNTLKLFFNTYKITIIVAISVLFLVILYSYTTRQRWMVWQEDHYVEVDFDLEKYKLSQLKAFKEERIDLFKKITPNCNYVFFNNDGSVNIWYGKNKSKELEYFTALGLHPETGKALKPITKYMIGKHICKQLSKTF
jgi:hypothetical protein